MYEDYGGLPSELKLSEGDIKTLEFNLPFSINIENSEVDVLKFNGNSLADKKMYNIHGPIQLKV